LRHIENYQQTNVAKQVTSYTKLIEIHMAENANVIEFLNEFQCLVDDVTIADLDFPKPQLIILLLKALPSLWHAFITTQGNQINITLATLIRKIV
jgi:hypothetical protein